MRQIIIVLFTCIYLRLPAQFITSSFSGYTGIGAYSTHFTDALSGNVNQAVLANCTTTVAAICAERRFMLKNLSNYNASVILPFKSGSVGIGLQYAGTGDFNSSKTSLSYGKKLSDKLTLGIQFNYYLVSINGYGSAHTLNAEAGVIYKVVDKVCIGFHAYNPVPSKYGHYYPEKLPAIYNAGFGYEATDKFYMSAEVIKEENVPAAITMGMQYVFLPQFFVRAGLVTGNNSYFFGLALQWSQLRIDMVTNWHPQLGITPAIAIFFTLRKTPIQQGE